MILGAEEKIINLEYNLFIEIRDKVKELYSKNSRSCACC